MNLRRKGRDLCSSSLNIHMLEKHHMIAHKTSKHNLTNNPDSVYHRQLIFQYMNGQISNMCREKMSEFFF